MLSRTKETDIMFFYSMVVETSSRWINYIETYLSIDETLKSQRSTRTDARSAGIAHSEDSLCPCSAWQLSHLFRLNWLRNSATVEPKYALPRRQYEKQRACTVRQAMHCASPPANNTIRTQAARFLRTCDAPAFHTGCAGCYASLSVVCFL